MVGRYDSRVASSHALSEAVHRWNGERGRYANCPAPRNVAAIFGVKQFPDALLLADMKTMDGGGGEARGVFASGGNILDFLALAGVDTAKSICAVRDEFRRAG